MVFQRFCQAGRNGARDLPAALGSPSLLKANDVSLFAFCQRFRETLACCVMETGRAVAKDLEIGRDLLGRAARRLRHKVQGGAEVTAPLRREPFVGDDASLHLRDGRHAGILERTRD